MDDSRFWIRASMWAALWVWAGSEWLARKPERFKARRGWFTVSAGLFLLHIVMAYHWAYHWSQDAALADVARQTQAVTGLDWSGGLYVNFAFAALWWMEAILLWRRPVPHSRWRIWTVRGVFAFMIVNGAVVFVQGTARWLGVALCVSLAAVWSWPRKSR